MEDNLLCEFGLHIKRLRTELGLSQETLALKAELDRTYISGIERGKRNVSLVNLFKLADALTLPAPQLLAFARGGQRG